MKKAIFLALAAALLAAGCSKGSSYSGSGTTTPPVSFLLSPPSGSTLPGATVGTVYSQTFTVLSGGTGPYSFGGVGLPPGLTVTQLTNNAGAISGTPTQSGQGILQFAVADAASHSEVEQYLLTITGTGNTLVISPSSLGPYTAGQPLTQTVTTTGSGAITWSVSGTLPNGINLGTSQATTNNLSGTFTRAGTFNFTLNTRDATGATGAQPFTVTVN